MLRSKMLWTFAVVSLWMSPSQAFGQWGIPVSVKSKAESPRIPVAVASHTPAELAQIKKDNLTQSVRERAEVALCDDCNRTLKGEALLSQVEGLLSIVKDAKKVGLLDIASDAKAKIDSIQEPIWNAKLELINKRVLRAEAGADMQALMEELDDLRAEAVNIKPSTKTTGRYGARDTKSYEDKAVEAQRKVLETWASKFGKTDGAQVAMATTTWANSNSGSSVATPSKVLAIFTKISTKAALSDAGEVATELVNYAGRLEEKDADRAASTVLALSKRLSTEGKEKGELEHFETAQTMLEGASELSLSTAKAAEIQRKLDIGLALEKDDALASQPNGPMSTEYQMHHEELGNKLQKRYSSACRFQFSRAQYSNCAAATRDVLEFQQKDFAQQAGAYDMMMNPLGRGDGVDGLRPFQGPTAVSPLAQPAQQQQVQQQQTPQFQPGMQQQNPNAFQNGMNGFNPNAPMFVPQNRTQNFGPLANR